MGIIGKQNTRLILTTKQEQYVSMSRTNFISALKVPTPIGETQCYRKTSSNASVLFFVLYI